METGLASRLIQELTYDRIIDTDESTTKTTVQYIVNNYNKLLKYLMRVDKIHKEEAEGIISNLYYEMEKKDEDYQIFTDEETGKIIPLEAYINKMLRLHVKRYFSNRKKRMDMEFSSTISVKNSDEEAESLFDFITDDRYTDYMKEAEYDLDTAISNTRHLRYSFGCDLFSMLYGRLIAANASVWEEYKESLGISKDLNNIEYKCKNNEDFLYLINAIAYKADRDKDSVINKLEKYVYCAKTIRNALSC